ncbi:COG3650 family protein [Paracoccus alkanivorans]|uniref:Uncharacterized protein n=1 Tax=Paracoccus alkanivorans TaxID=2116655 RepID=A0A3M0MQ09_9RHOB|nr:hypothetical protein [Paracoccus alkanivorans]RMC37820.1 hypothetical protein C9E81_03535 [Paracoccus alkanivorans]
MNPRFALLALMCLPLAACDEAVMADLRRGIGMEAEEAQPEDPAKPRPPAVSPLEVPIETGTAEPRLAVNANAETLNTAAFAARGNEPFWSVEVSGNTANYKTPENQGGRKVNVTRLTFAQGVEYVGTLDGLVFKLTLRGADCTDSMSGEKFPMTASLTARGKTSQGCAVPASGAAAETQG